MNFVAIHDRVLEGRPAGVSAAEWLTELDLPPFDAHKATLEDETRLGGLLLLEGRLGEAAELLPRNHPLCSLALALQGEASEGHPLARALSQGELPPAHPDYAPESFFGSLCVLCTLRAMWDWIDWAPAAFEFQVEEKLRLGWQWLDKIPTRFAVLEPRWLLERARYFAFLNREQDCLEMLRRLFSIPCTGEQLPVLERARELLRNLDDPQFDISRIPRQSPPSRLSEWLRFQQALESAPTLTRSLDSEQLKSCCVDAIVAILRCHQAFWLELGPNGWLSQVYRGPSGYSRWSQTLVDRCLREGPVLYDRQIENPSVSLILSEARSVLVCPVIPGTAVLYVSHQSLEGRYAEGDLELVQFFARLAAVQCEILGLRDRRREAASTLTHQREELERSLDVAGVGAAWLDRQGRLMNWNPTLQTLLGGEPQAGENLSLRWVLQDQNPYQSFVQQALLRKGKADTVVRLLDPQGGLRWMKTTLDGVPEDDWQLLLVEDVTHENVEDVLLLLEQERHALAAELHDGPAQTGAALGFDHKNLPAREAQSLARLRAEMADMLRWLRSPSQDNLTFEQALRNIFSHNLLEVDTSISAPADLPWTPQTIAIYRSLQDLAEHLSEHSAFDSLSVDVSRVDDQLRVVVDGDQDRGIADLEPESQELILQRLALVRGEWRPQGERSRWEMQVPLSPAPSAS